jgi:phytoene dehydrogenase-like protein
VAPGFVHDVFSSFYPLGVASPVLSSLRLEHHGLRWANAPAPVGNPLPVHHQLVFRPAPGLGRAETPVPGLYLASASAHPGGGVHGACGANAARAAILHDRLNRLTRRCR